MVTGIVTGEFEAAGDIIRERACVCPRRKPCWIGRDVYSFRSSPRVGYESVCQSHCPPLFVAAVTVPFSAVPFWLWIWKPNVAEASPTVN